MDRTLGLRTRISLMVALGALLVAAGVAVVLVNTVKLRNSAEASTRGNAYLVSVINVERLVVDAETGLRGYVITGRTLFLAPTYAARAGLPAALATLQRTAAADGGFRAQARALATAAASYMNGYVPKLMSLYPRHPAAARSFQTTLSGKEMVDGVRTRTAALERLVSSREGARQVAARNAAGEATTEAIIVLVLVTILTLLLGTFLGRLVITRERARRASEATTRALRESLLPVALPAIPGCDAAVRFLPAGAGELVGGDFYDVFPVGDGQWAIVVGDVCGKGAQAAALTAMARWTLRSVAADAVAPDDALAFLNRTMLGLDLRGRFITIAYVLLTLEGEEARVRLGTAGHPPPILVPAGGPARPLRTHGPMLGVWADIDFKTCDVRLRPGDAIVLYTDGVSDAGPGDQRLPLDALQGHRGANAEQLVEAVQSLAGARHERQRDDIAILALRFCGRDGGRTGATAHSGQSTAGAGRRSGAGARVTVEG